MKNKEGFFKTISGDLKRGIVRPIFVSGELAVFSVANSFYVASDYTQNKDGYVAFLVNSKMVRAMMLDNAFLEHLMLTTAPEDLKQMMFRLTDRTFQTFQTGKGGNSWIELNHKLVDPELEEWIVKTYGAPPVFAAGEGQRRTLMDSVKSLFHKENRL